MIKVSVIVPIYNAEKYLQQCLDSIVAQSLKDIEIILIDDGSVDSSAEICKRYLNDSRVSYYHKENEGLAAARQDGIDRSHGEYIGFVDSDDWIEPDMYEKMYNAARSNDSDVVVCNAFINDEKVKKIPLEAGAYSRETIVTDILPKTIISIDDKGQRFNIRWSNCLRIYKKANLDKYNISFCRSFRRSQDLPFTFEVMLEAQNFYYLDEFLYHNHQEAGSLSRGYTKDMWSLIKPLIIHIQEVIKKYPDLDLEKYSASTTFFLSLDCIYNEFKPDAPSKSEKIAHINEVINDDVCRSCLDILEYNRLCSFYRKIFYANIKDRNAKKLIKDYNYYYSDTKKKIDPMINKLTETKLYKIIRGR